MSSEEWERLNKKSGMVCGVDKNGDRYERLPTSHEKQFMARRGCETHPSVADEEEYKKRGNHG